MPVVVEVVTRNSRIAFIDGKFNDFINKQEMKLIFKFFFFVASAEQTERFININFNNFK